MSVSDTVKGGRLQLLADDLEQTRLQLVAAHQEFFGGNHAKIGAAAGRLEAAIDLVTQVAAGLRGK